MSLIALYVLARLMLGVPFIVFGIRNIKNIPALGEGIGARGMPQSRTAAWTGVILQIATGVLTASGLTGPIGVMAGVCGIVFVYVAAYLFHNFWAFQGEERVPHLNAWLMNTALAGGFLLVAATSL